MIATWLDAGHLKRRYNRSGNTMSGADHTILWLLTESATISAQAIGPGLQDTIAHDLSPQGRSRFDYAFEEAMAM